MGEPNRDEKSLFRFDHLTAALLELLPLLSLQMLAKREQHTEASFPSHGFIIGLCPEFLSGNPNKIGYV
ncbi:MAG TPA: hypothetical protein VGG33_17665 [Polyangia bacterium]